MKTKILDLSSRGAKPRGICFSFCLLTPDFAFAHRTAPQRGQIFPFIAAPHSAHG